MGAFDGLIPRWATHRLTNSQESDSVATKKKPSGIDSSISYIVLRKNTSPDQHVVCKTRGPYTVSPILVSYNEASLKKDELETLNPRDTYCIAKVTLL